MATAATAERYECKSNADYHQSEGVSRSQVEDFVQDPWLFYVKHVERSFFSTATDSMVFGTALHERVLLDQYETVAFIPDEIEQLSGKGSVLAKRKWKEENPAEHYLKPNDSILLDKCVEAIKSHEAARRLLFDSEGENEVAVRGRCPITGLMIRAKFDRVIEMENRLVVVDLKKASDASPGSFAYSVRKYGYDRQQAFYTRIAEQWLGKPVTFYFVAVQPGLVPMVEVYEIDEDEIDDADYEIFASGGYMERLGECFETGNWRAPGYGEPKRLLLPRRNSYQLED